VPRVIVSVAIILSTMFVAGFLAFVTGDVTP
jgi:hypothetical protein